MPYDADTIEAMIKADDPNLAALLSLVGESGRRFVSVEAVVRAINEIATRPRDPLIESDASRLMVIALQLAEGVLDPLDGVQSPFHSVAVDDLRAIAARLRDLP